MKNTLLIIGILSSSLAFAGHQGDVSCDPHWRICLQSSSLDSAETLHFVNGIRMNGQATDNLGNQGSDLAIITSTNNVVLQISGNPDLVIGQISEPVGQDAHTAMSRELVLLPGFALSTVVNPGPQVTYCNETALGFIYERYTYKTEIFQLGVLQDGKLLATLEAKNLVEPAIAVHSSPIPCKNGQ